MVRLEMKYALSPGVPAGVVSGVVLGVLKKPVDAGVALDFPDAAEPDDDTKVSDDDDIVDMVSTELIVEDRFGMGKPLNDEKSQDIAFLGVGRVEVASEDEEGGTDGSSLFTLLPKLLILAVSLSFSSRLLPTIHQMPDGLLLTLISSVFCMSISPTSRIRVSQMKQTVEYNKKVTYIPYSSSRS